ncbi:MAG: DUF4276 family protein [Caldilineaceae bacterium]
MLKIYVEGGGQRDDLKTKCRQGFSKFFERAGFKGRMPRIVACGSRNDAYDSFCTALKQAKPDEFPILLVDSEEPFNPQSKPWPHLKVRDDWDKPENASDEHVYLMVRCMETWFLADRKCLEKFYGQGFHTNTLPQRTDIENISKQDIFTGLANATRHCKTKGSYDKGNHSFDILALLDPLLVVAVSPHGKRLIESLLQKA